jgi:hypothetical protein
LKNSALILILCFYTVIAFSQQKVKIVQKDGKYSFMQHDKVLLSYQYAMVYPPAGIDTNYRRSGFIHPLNTINGHTLTQIQPKDHYHHYGIWNPWTHVLYDGDTVDFWNIKGKKGTVAFVKLVDKKESKKDASFTVLHDHIKFKGGRSEVALHETQTMKVTPINNDMYALDFDITYQCATDKPFNILAYRYAGLGWRATNKWTKTNSEILTSEGKSRKEADNTNARWCIVQGKLDNDYGGVVMMSHPSNYNHPEPMRIWPETNTPTGEVFANFSPTKNKDWTFEPGKKYNLKYRLLVFNGKVTKEVAENQWQAYTKISNKK